MISLQFLRVDEGVVERTGERWWAEVSAGVRHLGRVVVLRQVAIAAAVACLVIGFLEPVCFAVVGQGLHRRPTFLGVVLAVQGVGAVLGGVTASAVIRRLGEGPVVGLGLALLAAGSALLLPSNLVVVLGGAAVLGASLPWLIVAANTLMQRRTPNHLQGRVAAAFDTLASVPQTISIAAGAALLAVVDYRWLLVAVAAVVALSAGYLLSRREQWAGRWAGSPAPGEAAVVGLVPLPSELGTRAEEVRPTGG